MHNPYYMLSERHQPVLSNSALLLLAASFLGSVLGALVSKAVTGDFRTSLPSLYYAGSAFGTGFLFLIFPALVILSDLFQSRIYLTALFFLKSLFVVYLLCVSIDVFSEQQFRTIVLTILLRSAAVLPVCFYTASCLMQSWPKGQDIIPTKLILINVITVAIVFFLEAVLR